MSEEFGQSSALVLQYLDMAMENSNSVPGHPIEDIPLPIKLGFEWGRFLVNDLTTSPLLMTAFEAMMQSSEPI